MLTSTTFLRSLPVVAMVAVSAWGLQPSTARADHFHRLSLDRLAFQLEEEAEHLDRTIEWELRRSPAYRHISRDSQQLLNSARHFHSMVHRNASRDHLRRDIREVCDNQQHLHQVLRMHGSTIAVERSLRQVQRLVAVLEQQLEGEMRILPVPQPGVVVPQSYPPVPYQVIPRTQGSYRQYDRGPVLYAPGMNGSSQISVRLGNVRLQFVDGR